MGIRSRIAGSRRVQEFVTNRVNRIVNPEVLLLDNNTYAGFLLKPMMIGSAMPVEAVNNDQFNVYVHNDRIRGFAPDGDSYKVEFTADDARNMNAEVAQMVGGLVGQKICTDRFKQGSMPTTVSDLFSKGQRVQIRHAQKALAGGTPLIIPLMLLGSDALGSKMIFYWYIGNPQIWMQAVQQGMSVVSQRRAMNQSDMNVANDMKGSQNDLAGGLFEDVFKEVCKACDATVTCERLKETYWAAAGTGVGVGTLFPTGSYVTSWCSEMDNIRMR